MASFEKLPLLLRGRVAVQRALVKRLFRLPAPVLEALAYRRRAPVDGQVLDLQTAVMLQASDIGHDGNFAGWPIDKARRWLEVGHESIALPPQPGVVQRDDTLPGPAGPMRFRLYTPKGLEARAPLIVYVHGGGWVGGSVQAYNSLCQYLATRCRCRVASIDYRLAPEHPFPAAVDDSTAAFRWLASHASLLGVDPSRIAVAGDSAGGNLAAVVAYRTRMDRLRPALQVLVCPGLDASASGPSRRTHAKGYFLTDSLISWFVGHYLSPDVPDAHPDVSPLLLDDLRGLPPAHVITAGFDPLRDEGNAYAERLKAAGVPTHHRCFDTLIHGFTNMAGAVDAARAALDELADAVRVALHAGQAAAEPEDVRVRLAG